MSWRIADDIMVVAYGVALVAAAAFLVISRRFPQTLVRRRGRLKAWGWVCMALAAVMFVSAGGTSAGDWLVAPAILLIGAALFLWFRAGRLGLGRRGGIESAPDDNAPVGKHAAGRGRQRLVRDDWPGPGE